jgi:hypothetical protein
VVSSDDASSSGFLLIGKNLDSALRYLRLSDLPRVLWIDGICINQNDMEERSQQVHRMGSIFSLAERVVAWLGSSSLSSQLALSTLEHLGGKVVLTKDNHHEANPDDADRVSERWADSQFMLPYDEATWQAITGLLKRLWFERMWVLQEVQLGSHRSILQCGEDFILWQKFRHAILCIVSKRHKPPGCAQLTGSLWIIC